MTFRTETTASATEMTAESVALGGTDAGEHWYVAQGEVTISERITVTGDVRLILADGATLTASAGITVEGGNSLTIYAQSEGDGMGQLIATAGETKGTSVSSVASGASNAGIGGTVGNSAGTITINGGDITATGGYLTYHTIADGNGYLSATGAGIGGGGAYTEAAGDGGTVCIYGGVVTASGGSSFEGWQSYMGTGAGIGGGGSHSGEAGDGGNVTIHGGTVTAVGGSDSTKKTSGTGAGIGGGGTCRGTIGASATVNITGGTVSATGGAIAYNASGAGAGIGGGGNASSNVAGDGGVVTISGGTVTATGGRVSSSDSWAFGTGAGIGGGGGSNSGAGGVVTIRGGTVTATGGAAGKNSGTGAGIGGGGASSTAGQGGMVTIYEGTVRATGGAVSDYAGGTGAGIGGGGTPYSHVSGDGGNVKIYGGNVTATGGNATTSNSGAGAGIGGGGANSGTAGAGATLTVAGGTVSATGGRSNSYSGAAIGSGSKGSNGSALTASGSVLIYGGMEYGTSTWGSGMTFRAGTGITKNDFSTDQYARLQPRTLAFSTQPSDVSAAYLSDGILSAAASLSTSADSDVITYQWYTCDAEGNDAMPVDGANAESLNLSGVTVGTYYYYCKAYCESTHPVLIATSNVATATVTARVVNNENGTIVLDEASQIYDGTMKTPTILSITDDLGNEIDIYEYRVEYTNNVNAGTATVTIVDAHGGNYEVSGSTSFVIAQSGTSFGDDDLTVDDAVEDNTYTYGETVNLTITPEATGEAAAQADDTADQTDDTPVMAMAMLSLYEDAPTADQMALYATIDGVETQLCAAVSAGNDGTYALSYHTTDKLLAVGTHTITAKYVGDDNMADYSESFTITIVAKPVTATYVGDTITKAYDTDTTAAAVVLTIADDDRADETDEITATATATYASADAAEHVALVFSNLATDGAQASYYEVSAPTDTTGVITPRTVTNEDITITLETTSYTADGTAKEPSVSIVDNAYGNAIAQGEYNVAYADNTSAGTATIAITDVDGGNYIVSGSTTFTIVEESRDDQSTDTDGNANASSPAIVTTWYTVSLSTSGGGTIAPELSEFSVVTMKEGTDYTFSITPDTGYAIAAVYVDGTNIGAVTSYTIERIASDRAIHVDFVSTNTSAEENTPDKTEPEDEDALAEKDETTTQADSAAAGDAGAGDADDTTDGADANSNAGEEEPTQADPSESNRSSAWTIAGGVAAAIAGLGGAWYLLLKRKNESDDED